MNSSAFASEAYPALMRLSVKLNHRKTATYNRYRILLSKAASI